MHKTLRWWLKKNGLFDIRSYYNVLRGSPRMAFPWRSVWNLKAPRWVCFFFFCFFVWGAAWEKILTCDNLIWWGYIMPSWCCMCRGSGESVDHILLHCSMAGMLWNFVFHSFGIQWLLPKKGCRSFGWMVEHVRKAYLKHLDLFPSCLMWTLWHERNQHTFEEVKSENQVLDCFTTTFFEWSRAWGFTSGITVLHFISSLSLIPCTTHYVIT